MEDVVEDCVKTEPDVLLLVLEEAKKQSERMDGVEEALQAIRFDLNGVVEMLREFGLRLHLVEKRQSETPTPFLASGGD